MRIYGKENSSLQPQKSELDVSIRKEGSHWQAFEKNVEAKKINWGFFFFLFLNWSMDFPYILQDPR